MSTPKLPIGDGHVPDKVLEELLAAFANDPAPPAMEIDLDDPSIDLLLGLTPEPDAPGPGTSEPVAGPDPVIADPPVQADFVTKPVSQVAPGSGAEVLAGPSTGAPSTGAAATVKATRKPIQIGAGDDLPDAVYLNEEGEERLRGTSGRATEASIRGERTTILIGDDEIEGSSGGIPIGTASMDPRLRARRIAVNRAVSRRRLKWFVVGGVVLVLLTSGFALLGSSLFAIDHVPYSGNHRIDQNDLDAAVKRLMGHPVLLIDTHSIEAQLEQSPWVRTARVSTDFPHDASIELLERVPLATYLGTDGTYRIIDVDGAVVDTSQGRPIEFMLITGPGVNAEPGRSAGQAFAHAAELIEALTPAVRSRTASVTVSETGELSLVFHTGAIVIFGAPTELLDKMIRLEAALKRDGADKQPLLNVSTNPISYKS